MKRVLIPVDLGGSPTACCLRPPRRKADLADKVDALIRRYQAERKGEWWEVGFFHGGLPTPLQLQSIGDLPARLSCSPADLHPKAAARLFQSGVTTIELEVGTFQPRVLRKCRRGYTSSKAWAVMRGLVEMGFKLGIVLNPGMPGFRPEDCIEDAASLVRSGAPPVDFVRLNPAIAWAESAAAQWVKEGSWVPLDVEETVVIIRKMVDILESANITIARIGVQPGQDILAEAVAGPVHPNLRGLVEAERFRDRLMASLKGLHAGQAAHVRVNPKDVSWVKGEENNNIRAARQAFGLVQLKVVVDPMVPRGEVRTDLVQNQDRTG